MNWALECCMKLTVAAGGVMREKDEGGWVT